MLEATDIPIRASRASSRPPTGRLSDPQMSLQESVRDIDEVDGSDDVQEVKQVIKMSAPALVVEVKAEPARYCTDLSEL